IGDRQYERLDDFAAPARQRSGSLQNREKERIRRARRQGFVFALYRGAFIEVAEGESASGRGDGDRRIHQARRLAPFLRGASAGSLRGWEAALCRKGGHGIRRGYLGVPSSEIQAFSAVEARICRSAPRERCNLSAPEIGRADFVSGMDLRPEITPARFSR